MSGDECHVPDLVALAESAAQRIPAAELHGTVCGLVSCPSDTPLLQDLVELLGADELTDQSSVEAFVDASAAALHSEDMSFALLLPDDAASLERRIEALSIWCGSYLAGFAAGLARRGVGSLEECSEEVREIVGDFAAIAEVEPDAGGHTGESAEVDFAELAEFVKVGSLLLLSAFADDSDDPSE